MKTAAIISCNDSYDYDTRTKYVYNSLQSKGYLVTFIVADFDHRNKRDYCVNRPDNIHYIHVRSYKKNFSLGRILSHFDFAIGIKKHLMNQQYDLIYHCAPPNLTIRVLSKIREKQNFRLVTEIGDMWPETLPISDKIKKLLFIPLIVWKGLRDRNLYNSDFVIAECNLFRRQLEQSTHLKYIKTMYFCKQANFVDKNLNYFKNSMINLCYLGSINNIIDIEMIGILVKELSKYRQIVVHIIGDGERRSELINTIELNGGKVVFYGKVFSEDSKRNVFSQVDYCLNIMKTSVNVGMTMKSLDYFSFGIPIINNVGGDIEELISEEPIGFNIDKENIQIVAKKINELSFEEYLKMSKEVQNIHNKYFSISKFNQEFGKII